MDVRQLTYFVAVAEERTFTAAALRLNLAQSAVSNAIRALERELGAVLFTRGAREVALTDAGAALLPRAHEAIATLSAARAAVDEVVGGLRGEVRIGTLTSTPTQVDLPALLGDFHHSHPAVHLHLVVSPEGSHGLVRDLVGGRLDVAFVGLADPASAGIHLREIARVPLDLIVPATHRLADASRVRIDQLATEPFVDVPAGYGTRVAVDSAFARAGIHREVVLECFDLTAAADFVAHGLGIAVLPRTLALDHHAVRVVTLDFPDLTWPFSIATSTIRPTSRSTQALLDQIDAYLIH
jgi:DNA-binding transcriptional LysR family regulator